MTAKHGAKTSLSIHAVPAIIDFSQKHLKKFSKPCWLTERERRHMLCKVQSGVMYYFCEKSMIYDTALALNRT